jgi:hypothetical protein
MLGWTLPQIASTTEADVWFYRTSWLICAGGTLSSVLLLAMFLFDRSFSVRRFELTQQVVCAISRKIFINAGGYAGDSDSK